MGIVLEGPKRSLVKAARRLNPAIDLDVDVVAVRRAAGASTKEEWTAGTLTSTTADQSGAVRLSESGSRDVFKSGGVPGDATVKRLLNSTVTDVPVGPGTPTEILWMDFWPDPAVLGPDGFVLHSLDLVLGRRALSADDPYAASEQLPTFAIHVARFDDNWNREAITDPIALAGTSIPIDGGTVTVNFRNTGRILRVRSGRTRTRTGSGRTSAGAERTLDITIENDRRVSHIAVPLGFSIGISMVTWPTTPWVGSLASGFDVTTFWRSAEIGSLSRSCGPYSPDAKGPVPLDTTKNPGYGFLETGAVPGFGAIDTAAVNGSSVPYGQWGISRQVTRQHQQHVSADSTDRGWNRPYHVLKAVTYAATGTAKKVLDLGAQPASTGEVHFRGDSAEPTGTSITYSVRGSNTNNGADWSAAWAALDGDVFTGSKLYRYYEVTATLNASADTLATPTLNAVFVTERVRYATWRYQKEIDSTSSIDPITGQSSIGELKLSLLKLKADAARDLVTRIVTENALANIEAWVYVRETRTGTRHFLNLYRLEDREPSDGEETLTFVSGMDRLKAVIPQKSETDQYPTDGTLGTISAVSYNTTTRECTISVAGTPFAGKNIAGWRFDGATGPLAGLSFFVASAPAHTSSAFTIVLENNGQRPTAGQQFRLHSGKTQRLEVVYNQERSLVYADILANQAAVPSRYRGSLPAATAFNTTNRLTSDGQQAIQALEKIALVIGGGIAWRKGRIDYFDIYGPKSSVETWNERDYSDVKPVVGASRRMPSVNVKYGYDFTAKAFTGEATFDDFNALVGMGRANLFDVFELPEEICRWLADYSQASDFAKRMLKAWATGARIWRVSLNVPRPWRQEGDCVTISTDAYTDRRLDFSADGLTDRGTPVKGRVSAVGVIVGKNLVGTEFLVAIPGLDNVTAVGSDGTNDGTGAYLTCPNITLSQVNLGRLSIMRLKRVLISFTKPTSPYYDHMEFDVVSDTSGDSNAKDVQTIESPAGFIGFPGVTYTVTPYVVTTGGRRTAGAAQQITVSNNLRIGPVGRTDANGNDDGVVESSRGAVRRSGIIARRVDEDLVRGGEAGVPVRGSRFRTEPTYNEAGTKPLIDTTLERFTADIKGPTGAFDGTVIERGSGRGDGGFSSYTGDLVSTARDSRTALLNNHFRYATDGAAGVVESATQSFAHTSYLDASRRPVTMRNATLSRDVVANDIDVGQERSRGGFTNATGALVSTAVDSRAALLNNHFRYATDGAAGVVESATQSFTHGSYIDASRRPITIRNASLSRDVVANDIDVGQERSRGGFTNSTGALVSTSVDSRAALINNHFRYATDSADGVVENSNRSFIIQSYVDGSRRPTQLRDATQGQDVSGYNINRGQLSARRGTFARAVSGEEGARSGVSGVPTSPSAAFSVLPQYNSTGDTPLIDPVTKEILSGLAIGANVNGASSVKFGPAAGQRFPVNRHVEQPLSLNGEAESFAIDYENIPEVGIFPTIWTLPGASSTSDRKIECRAQSLTVSGFTSRAVLSTGASTTAQSENPSADQNGTTSATVSCTADLSDAFWNLTNANATSTTYTCNYAITTMGSSSALRRVYVYKNDGASSTNWTLVGSQTYDQGINALDDSISFEAAMGANFDIKIVFDNPGGSGAVGDELLVKTCTYNKVVSGTETSLTPAGSELVCIAREKV